MSGPMLFEGTLMRVPSITFKSFDGTGALALNVNFAKEPLSYSYAFNLKNVSAQKAVDASIDAYVTTKNYSAYKDMLYGTLNLAYSGSGRGTTADLMIASQAGTGSYNLVDARIKGVGAIKTINSIVKDKGDEIRFQKIEGALAMRNKVFSYTATTTGKAGVLRETGGINVDQMVYSPDMKIQCDLRKDVVDIEAVRNLLPPGIQGYVKSIDFLADDNGIVPLDVKFTGVVSENHYSWDRTRLESLAQKKIQKAAQQDIQQKASDVGKDLGSKLKGLFGK